MHQGIRLEDDYQKSPEHSLRQEGGACPMTKIIPSGESMLSPSLSKDYPSPSSMSKKIKLPSPNSMSKKTKKKKKEKKNPHFVFSFFFDRIDNEESVWFIPGQLGLL
ncbi:hypothetical protein LWI29_030220 [Acer saccharum]|uniref:Uncharacterized protein n=1 Tax=Acer saccharum TaxID=4024 RepID=A0AA39S9I1_ACESA|nr:hypothetical protein LWI29_030220 [Acer saccharum]